MVRRSVPQEIYLWGGSAALPDKEVELDANDLVRTKHALTTATRHAQAREWLVPLPAQREVLKPKGRTAA